MERRLSKDRVTVDFIIRDRGADPRPAAEQRHDAVVAESELVTARAAIAIVEGPDDPVEGDVERCSAIRLRRDTDFLGELLRPLVAALVDHVERSALAVAVLGDTKLDRQRAV